MDAHSPQWAKSEIVLISALQHWSYCPRQCGLIHLDRAWDENIDPFSNIVRVAIATLRKKLGEPQVVRTVTGAGYQI